jgi:peptide/nickel transport system substrate-binding protein
MQRLGVSARIVAAAVGAALAIAACGGGQSSGGTSNKTLVVDKSFDLKTADPQREFEFAGGPIAHALYDTLLTFKGGDVTKPLPLVASGYTASADARTYTFKLRTDVKFADGTPLTSADVLFSLNRLINIHGNPSFLLDGVTVSAPDEHTVVLTSKDPNPAIPFIVPNPALGIVNSKVVKAHGGTDQPGADKSDTAEAYLNQSSAGSGPYKLQSFSTTSEVVLKRNESYWGPSKPTFQTVVIRNVEAPTQLIDVQKGTNEVAIDLSPDQASGLSGNGKLQVKQTASPNVFFLFANDNPQVSPATPNPHFQTAVRYGLDYEGIVKLAGSGAVQSPGVIPTSFLGALPASAAVKRDVAKAKAELQASGLSNPSLDLEYPSDITLNGLSFQTLAEKIKSNLADVGITVNLKGAPVATSLANYRAGKEQLGLWYWGPDYPDPNDYLVFLPGQLVAKRAGWVTGASPAIEQMGAQAGSTADNARREQLYQQIQTSMNQSGPFFPLLQPGQIVAGSKNLTNVEYNPSWLIDVAAVGGS